jgi:hypothetical protein
MSEQGSDELLGAEGVAAQEEIVAADEAVLASEEEVAVAAAPDEDEPGEQVVDVVEPEVPADGEDHDEYDPLPDLES